VRVTLLLVGTVDSPHPNGLVHAGGRGSPLSYLVTYCGRNHVVEQRQGTSEEITCLDCVAHIVANRLQYGEL
jgi:hypothetical protein